MSDYPDFTITALLKGLYAGNPKALAVDVDGNLIAMLKALYGVLPTTLQCDVDGNMQINLNAQGLPQLTSRAISGAPDRESEEDAAVPPGLSSLLTITGKGQIYSCLVIVAGAESHGEDIPYFTMDGKVMNYLDIVTLMSNRLYHPNNCPAYVSRYDDINFLYTVSMSAGFTFETNYVLSYLNNTEEDVSVIYDVAYSLVIED